MKRAAPLRGRLVMPILIAVLAGAVLGACRPGGSSAAENSGEETTLRQAEEWYYDSFNEEQKMAYDAFRSAAEDPFGEEPVPIRDGQGEAASVAASDLDTVYQGFLYDHPEIFWLSRTYGYRPLVGQGGEERADAVAAAAIPASEEELARQKENFEKAADEFLQDVKETDSDRDRAAAIYEKLASQTEYDETAMYDERLEAQHTACGVIIDGRGVCDGISLAYKYLLARCGIRCLAVPGESRGAAHVWNLIYWDGTWHEADLTWDIASDGNDRMQYFDLTTEEMNKDHQREEDGIASAVPQARKKAIP